MLNVLRGEAMDATGEGIRRAAGDSPSIASLERLIELCGKGVDSMVEIIEGHADMAQALKQAQADLRQQSEARQRAEQQADHLANHDSLTGLGNRRLLTDRLNQAISLSERGGK